MEPAIVTTDLTCRYGRTEAVRGLTLTVEPGSIFALLGQNGAGKTSTIRMLMNIIRPSGGRAAVLGVAADFDLTRFRTLGALPLRAGAAVRDERDRLEIVRVQRQSDGCEVRVRQFNGIPLGAPSALRREFHFVLRNSERGEAIDGENLPIGPMGGRISGGFLGRSMDGNAGGGFWISHVALRFPARSAAAANTPRIDGAWLDGAELVVIESADAGRVTRSLAVDGFRMKAPDR